LVVQASPSVVQPVPRVVQCGVAPVQLSSQQSAFVVHEPLACVQLPVAAHTPATQ
jgi:hypothetical protein